MGNPFDRPAPIPTAELARWLGEVASGEWTWTRNSRCKYVTLRIDTRVGAYGLEDRDGKAITIEELTYQLRP